MLDFLLCTLLALLYAALVLLVLEVVAWVVKLVLGVEAPPRVRQLVIGIVLIVFVIGAIMCLRGTPWFPVVSHTSR